MNSQAYRKVFQEIREQILSGELRPGDQLPSERELCEKHGVSRITMRHALRLLEEQGLLERYSGKGTFVRAPRTKKLPLLNNDYAGSIRQQAPGLERELLGWRRGIPPAHVAELLGMEVGEECLIAERVDCLNGEKLAFDRAYIPKQYTNSIDDELLKRVDFLDEWMRRECLAMSHALEGIEAVAADAESVKLLGVALNCPMLLTRDTIYAMDGRPLAVFETFYRGDRFKLVSTLERSAHGATRH